MKRKKRIRRPGALERAKKIWHQWFAWYPIVIDSKEGRRHYRTIVWLQKVWRSRQYYYASGGCGISNRYRLIERQSNEQRQR